MKRIARWYGVGSGRRKARGLAMALAVVGPAAGSHAQPVEGEVPDPWDVRLALRGGLSFGNTSSYDVGTSFDVTHESAAAELSLGGSYAYAEASDVRGVKFVSQRLWALAAAIDIGPAGTVSPFAFGSVESSLQARLDRRWIGGAGIKYAFLRKPGVRLDLSPALLLVRTEPRASGAADAPADTDVRGSLRLRAFREREQDKVKLRARIYYQPEIGDFGSYLLRVALSAEVPVADPVGIELSFDDRYDSEAESRGARSNNYGQVRVGLSIRF